MTDFSAIALRCAQATGPDRELDGLIFKAIEERPGDVWTRDLVDDAVWMRQDPEDRVAYDTPRQYTASIDAALTIVPDGMDWRVDTMTGLPGAIVAVPNAWLSDRTAPMLHHAASPALALCVAALRALSRAVVGSPTIPSEGK